MLFGLLAFLPSTNDAVVPVPVDNAGWMRRHEAICKVAQKGEAQIVFLGASIIQFFGGPPDTGGEAQNRGKATWDYYYGADKPLNMGISGDRTQHVLWRLDHGGLGTCKPKVVVINVGSNNLASNTPDEIAAGMEAICDRLHELSPSSGILLLGIFPRGLKNSPFRPEIVQVNSRLAAWAPSHQVQFLDIGPVFLQPNGDLTNGIRSDLLHPTPLGYRKWAEAMEPTLAKMMNRAPKPPAPGKVGS